MKKIGKLDETDPKEFDDFALRSCSNIDEYSLFTPQSKKDKPKLKQINEDPLLDEEEIKRLTKRLNEETFSEFKETIRFMLDNDVKLEQEILD